MVEERADERAAGGHGRPDPAFPVEHVTIHGQQIAYRRGGEGPALLFLHGIAGSSQTWVPAMELLRAEYTMVSGHPKIIKGRHNPRILDGSGAFSTAGARSRSR